MPVTWLLRSSDFSLVKPVRTLGTTLGVFWTVLATWAGALGKVNIVDTFVLALVSFVSSTSK